MRGFRCVPVKLLFSEVMTNLTSFERDVVHTAQLAQDDRHCLPWDAPTLLSIIFPTRRFVAIREIAAARDKLVALGVFIHKASQRKEWLEIHPDFRHSEGQNETSYGDDTPPPEQTELGLGPTLVKPAARKARGAKNQPVESRAEEKRTEPDSARGMDSLPPPVQRSSESGNQDVSSVEKPFRATADFIDEPKWRTLCELLGQEELDESGLAWVKRYRMEYDAVNTAMQDWLAKSPAERRKHTNPAAFFNQAWANEKRKFGT